MMETIDSKEIEDIEDPGITNIFDPSTRIINKLIWYPVLFDCNVTNIDVTYIIQIIRNEELVINEFRISQFEMECMFNIYYFDVLLDR